MKFKQIKNILAFLIVGTMISAFDGGHAAPPEKPKPTKSAPAKKVLLIGLDGIRVDILAKANTPNIDALAAGGTSSFDAYTGMPTVSGSGWSSILTGVWSDKHGVNFYNNDFSKNDFKTYPDFLTRIERSKPELNTLAVLVWPPLGTTANAGPAISDEIDLKINVNGDSMGYKRADEIALLATVAQLTHADPDVIFVYFGDTDIKGHDSGSLSTEYHDSIEVADTYVGALVAAMRQRATYDVEDWLILLSTDHGLADDGSHGKSTPEEHRVYYVASGAATVKGTPEVRPTNVDFTPTALTHLGVTIDPAWNLDGKVVGLKVTK